eukprot:15334639-Ditylum_brightwellii.AAC.1
MGGLVLGSLIVIPMGSPVDWMISAGGGWRLMMFEPQGRRQSEKVWSVWDIVEWSCASACSCLLEMQGKGSVCIVTGGGSGIGHAICMALAKGGASGISIVDINKSSAQSTAKSISSSFDCECLALTAKLWNGVRCAACDQHDMVSIW